MAETRGYSQYLSAGKTAVCGLTRTGTSGGTKAAFWRLPELHSPFDYYQGEIWGFQGRDKGS